MVIPHHLDLEEYFIFAVVRNPFVREVSHYLYRKRHRRNNYNKLAQKPFKEYLDKAIGIEPCQVNMLAGKPVDRILKYEDGLAEQVRNLPIFERKDIVVPHINSNPSYDYKQFYDEETAQIVLDYADHDFEEYGYSRGSWQ
jgi:hypothetical protein